ncbi:inorganic diphosphatase [Mycena leptocephala]|nr:inorganic diphosphatase [Mycena leptocephala]
MSSSSNYTARSVGAANTPEYRVFVSYNGHVVSALHDVPLFAGPSPSSSSDTNEESTPDSGSTSTSNSELILNMIVEASRWSNAQTVLTPAEAFAPIRHAMRGRRPAYVRNTFPHRGYIWNYGALPQTWAEGGPVHACELGERVAQVGDVRKVRVLGLLAPRDEGVLRWTLLVVDVADPLAARLRNVADLERECPGMITATKEWLRLYKLAEGKDENTIELDGEVKGRNTSTAFVDLTNVTISNSPGLVRGGDEELYNKLKGTQEEAAKAPPSSASKWWYIGVSSR